MRLYVAVVPCNPVRLHFHLHNSRHPWRTGSDQPSLQVTNSRSYSPQVRPRISAFSGRTFSGFRQKNEAGYLFELVKGHCGKCGFIILIPGL